MTRRVLAEEVRVGDVLVVRSAGTKHLQRVEQIEPHQGGRTLRFCLAAGGPLQWVEYGLRGALIVEAGS